LNVSGRYDRFNSRANDSNDIFTQTLRVGNGKLDGDDDRCKPVSCLKT